MIEELRLFKIIDYYQNKPYKHKKQRIYESKKQFKLNYTKISKWCDTLNNGEKENLFDIKCFELKFDIDNKKHFWFELDKNSIKDM